MNKLDAIKHELSEMKAENIVVLELSAFTSFTDYFIICEGTSDRHVAAIASKTVDALRDKGEKPLSVEGLDDGRWALVDYGDMIVHVFLPDVRAEYDLEGFWRDAKRID